MPTWTDKWQAVAAVLSAATALISVFFVVASLRQTSAALLAQNRSTDVASVISLFERLDSHWCRFRTAENAEAANFEFGQLIGYYELSCRLFRDKVFQTKAAFTLYQHLHDVLTVMQQNDQFQTRFSNLKSQPDNYENIMWLCNQPRSLERSTNYRPGMLKRILNVRAAS